MKTSIAPKRTRRRAGGKVYWETTADAFSRSFREAKRHDILVAPYLTWLRAAFSEALRHQKGGTTLHMPKILVTSKLAGQERAAYEAVSEQVIDRGIARFLPAQELREALQAVNRDELFVGVSYSAEGGVVLLYRGTLEPLLVPLGWFKSEPSIVRLDFNDLELTDYGQTVRLGDYEVAADAILYDFDAAYRRKAKARLRNDEGIGASIRRLRKQRGLRQEDFEGVSRRELSRIERGEIQNPRQETLQHISQRLGVSVDELGTY